MNKKPVLQLKNVSFAYAEGQPALRAVSLKVYPGERIAVLGNNGAGKSTLFLCCNGVLQPQQGELYLDENKMQRTKKDLMCLRQAVGLVFQDPDDQILASTVEAEISFGPLNMGMTNVQAQKQMDLAIEAMSLEEHRLRPPHYLSGGEKKRVTIADILAMEPRVILFDEPTSSLDPKNTLRLQQVLEAFSQNGITQLVATHDIDFAYEWAERVLVFCNGEILGDASPMEIFADAQLLKKAGLRKPLLYEVAEILSLEKNIPLPQKLPKRVEELLPFIKELSQ